MLNLIATPAITTREAKHTGLNIRGRGRGRSRGLSGRQVRCRCLLVLSGRWEMLGSVTRQTKAERQGLGSFSTVHNEDLKYR